MDSKKQQQCLTAGVAGSYSADTVVLFLISEAPFHCCRAQSADYSPGGTDHYHLFLRLWTLVDDACSDAVLCAISAVVIVGIDCVGSDSFDLYSRQDFLILDAFFIL